MQTVTYIFMQCTFGVVVVCVPQPNHQSICLQNDIDIPFEKMFLNLFLFLDSTFTNKPIEIAYLIKLCIRNRANVKNFLDSLTQASISDIYCITPCLFSHFVESEHWHLKIRMLI